jgi:hypothetical protein
MMIFLRQIYSKFTFKHSKFIHETNSQSKFKIIDFTQSEERHLYVIGGSSSCYTYLSSIYLYTLIKFKPH